jgi:hypothetical protein
MRNWQAKVKPPWTHWIEIFLAAAIVVVAAAVGAAQIYIYNQQAKIMGTQAEIAQKQADIMNTQAGIAQRQFAEMQSEGRAWVSIEPFIGGANWDADGLHIDFEFVTKNTGKLPALNVITDARLETFFVSSPEEHPITVLRKMMAEHKQQSMHGYPLFPNATSDWRQILTFARTDIDKYLQFMSTMGEPGHPEAPPPPSLREYISVEVVYLVDYISLGDVAHHQHWCIDQISAGDPNEFTGTSYVSMRTCRPGIFV